MPARRPSLDPPARRRPPAPTYTARRGRQSGQGTVEYVSLVAVLAVALVVTASLTGGGAIFDGVLRGMQRALCVATGGDCTIIDLTACATGKRETKGALGVSFAIVKLDGSLTVIRTEKSDGTFDITLVDGHVGGVTTGLGGSAEVHLGRGGLSTEIEASNEMLASLDRSRTWHRPDAASADQLVKDIREWAVANAGEHAAPGLLGSGLRGIAHLTGYHGDRLPDPDVELVEAGVAGTFKVKFGSAADVEAGLKTSIGGSVDRTTGKTTHVFVVGGDLGGSLEQAIGIRGGGWSKTVTLTVTYARDGSPLELAVKRVVTGDGIMGLRRPPGESKRTLKFKARNGVRSEVVARLDLQDDTNRAAYEHLMASLSPEHLGAAILGSPGLVGAARAGAAAAHDGSRELGDLMRDARVDVTQYATDGTEYGGGGDLAVGGKVGGSVSLKKSSSQLTGAWTRPPGGVFEERSDCLAGSGAHA